VALTRYNRLHSIDEDSRFVRQVKEVYPRFVLLGVCLIIKTF
jgi:hypothetical protein